MTSSPATATGAQAPIIALSGIQRSFGAVRALRGVDLAVAPGECVGLVGHNGAGKSTLMNVLGGLLAPDAGTYRIGSVEQAQAGARSPRASPPRDLGVGFVSQELLLAPNLSVAENARIAHRGLTGWGWRARAERLMRESLDAIFPGHGIHPRDIVGDLPISRQQMVEIARAFAGTGIRLMILDEPTSSLDATASAQLLAYVAERRRDGMAVILISHLLGEILSASTRVVVMRDGGVVMDRPSQGLTRADLVDAMGHVALQEHGTDAPDPTTGSPHDARPRDAVPRNGVMQVAIGASPGGVPFALRRGEVVGLTGLAGRGQTEFLHALARGRGVPAGTRRARTAFVAGDRRRDGVFPAWSVEQNLTVRALGAVRRFGLLVPSLEEALTERWRARIGIRTASRDTDLVTLSGGNQQKVLFARALASDAAVILMDDPMRGVDIGTKTDVYALVREEARAGRSFVWYSTETDELQHCDRVYVFRDGIPAAELAGHEADERSVVAASFA